MTPGPSTAPCQFCAEAAEYLLSVWNIFMPEKALIVNLLVLNPFYLCLYQLGGCMALSEVEV